MQLKSTNHHTVFLPLDGAKPTICIILRLSSSLTFNLFFFPTLSLTKTLLPFYPPSLPAGPAVAAPLQWTGVRWRSSGWRRKKRRGGRKHRGWRHDRRPAPWSRAHPCRSPETPRPCWTKWTDRTRRGASPHTPPTQLHPLYCFFIWITLHLLSPPQPMSPFIQFTNSWLSVHTFSSPPDIVAAVYQSGLVTWLISTPSFLPPSCPPVSPSHPKCFTSSPPANSSGCIVFCIVRVTLYMSCRKSVQWQKKNLKYPTAVTYRIWTYTDKLSCYLYFCDWF